MNQKLINIINKNKDIYKDELNMISLLAHPASPFKKLEIENNNCNYYILYRIIPQNLKKDLMICSFIMDTNIIDLNILTNNFSNMFSYVINITQEIEQDNIQFLNTDDKNIILDCEAILFTKQNFNINKQNFNNNICIYKLTKSVLEKNIFLAENLRTLQLNEKEQKNNYKTHDYLSKFINSLNKIKNGNNIEEDIYILDNEKSELSCFLTVHEDCIIDIYTLSQKRNSGYATILLNYYLENIISESVSTIYYSVDNSKNISSIKLAEKCGFKRKGYKISYIIE